jgi:hypothetical protein
MFLNKQTCSRCCRSWLPMCRVYMDQIYAINSYTAVILTCCQHWSYVCLDNSTTMRQTVRHHQLLRHQVHWALEGDFYGVSWLLKHTVVSNTCKSVFGCLLVSVCARWCRFLLLWLLGQISHRKCLENYIAWTGITCISVVNNWCVPLKIIGNCEMVAISIYHLQSL